MRVPPPERLPDPLNRQFYLPRLAREHYQADAVVFWTLTVFDRTRGWLTPAFHSRFRELMLHAAAREGLACPIYCLMPDHFASRLDGITIGFGSIQWHGVSPDLFGAGIMPSPVSATGTG